MLLEVVVARAVEKAVLEQAKRMQRSIHFTGETNLIIRVYAQRPFA
jgi:hypothetical protein